MTDSDGERLRHEYVGLIQRKVAIEHEVGVLEKSISGTLGVPLVDESGFPNSSIEDIPKVAHARRRIKMLNNDYTKVLLEIQSIIPSIMEMDKKGHLGVSSAPKETESHSLHQLEPIAIVNSVCPDSPACESGMKQGDLIIHFGPINANTISSLGDISTETKLREGQPFSILVARDPTNSNELVKLSLTPKKWNGPGLLGCHLLPWSRGC
jgi:26S proteasome non-ATPase regulatory subunit 9